ncbi:Lactonase, 7-bladed beta-propeller-domain-containing protein [Truncatella angustata]|uniref:Lactonase, 7-bladed beta-propeller-domain-containing protein n=1 Tax=Truncatella angustata TaxID=152316 RepID=A0A9P9A4N4_9PEZI|nr:Lactonase, 7-bladed beta-propeller-domain-containing protein [Truncatella angustata]KAH6661338.1 Lactonase, 7-bladed beta-propeller-domain-containing protein [Truncatella angustata]KAH8202184.1 hypothetical protein TruAng_003659 [Truncatella angustata]
MVRILPSLLLLSLGLVSANSMLTSRQESTDQSRRLIVGAPGQILSYDYDGKTFTLVANSSAAGTAPSWMIFKQPDQLYAVDENSNTTRLFNFNPANGSLSGQPSFVADGSLGVVSLEFNSNQTYLIGGSYSEGQVDIWDLSSPDVSLKLAKQIPLPGSLGPDQTTHRAHQIVLDPTGQFFAVADLGGDAIHFIDSSTWEINNSVRVEPAGAGPRHGAFLGGNATSLPKYYAVACESQNLIILWDIEKTENGKINLTNSQTLSTFGDAFPPSNATSAAAGELLASRNGRDIYVSNRISGNETDSISHFLVQDGKLVFADQVSSGGYIPRQLSFSTDELLVFGTNQGGKNGLVAFQRCSDEGTLTLAAALPNTETSATANTGPQFIMEVPILSTQEPDQC